MASKVRRCMAVRVARQRDDMEEIANDGIDEAFK